MYLLLHEHALIMKVFVQHKNASRTISIRYSPGLKMLNFFDEAMQL